MRKITEKINTLGMGGFVYYGVLLLRSKLPVPCSNRLSAVFFFGDGERSSKGALQIVIRHHPSSILIASNVSFLRRTVSRLFVYIKTKTLSQETSVHLQSSTHEQCTLN